MFQQIAALTDQSGVLMYEPYSMADTKFFIGVPPLTYPGVHLIRAYRNQPNAKLFSSLGVGGAFVSNRNLNGFVGLTVATESPMHAYIQLLDMAGVAFPILAADAGTGGSSFATCSSARVVNTPDWMKSTRSDFTVYTMACKNLAISGGVRKRI